MYSYVCVCEDLIRDFFYCGVCSKSFRRSGLIIPEGITAPVGGAVGGAVGGMAEGKAEGGGIVGMKEGGGTEGIMCGGGAIVGGGTVGRRFSSCCMASVSLPALL